MDEKFFDHRPRLARQCGRSAERRLLEEALGDLADRAAADGVDAGDRHQVGDQRMRGLRIGTFQSSQNTLVLRLVLGRVERKNVQVVGERSLPVEVLHQPPLPGRRQIERRDQRGEQADVAHPDFRLGDAVMRGGVET